MPQQTFANGEQLASVRAKLNGNAADVDARFGEVNNTLDLKADLVGGLVPAEQLPDLSPTDLGAVFVQTDLGSVLPATNPGSGRPWVDTSGLMRVGAGAGGTIPYIPSPTPVDGSVAMFDGLGGLKATGNATFPGGLIVREVLELTHDQPWFTRLQAEANLAETRFTNTYPGSSTYGGWSFRNGTAPEVEQAKIYGDGVLLGQAYTTAFQSGYDRRSRMQTSGWLNGHGNFISYLDGSGGCVEIGATFRTQSDVNFGGYCAATNPNELVYFYIGTYGAELMTLTPATGRVGIGTTAPQSQLEIYKQSAYISLQQPVPGTNGIMFGDGGAARGTLSVNGVIGEMRHEVGYSGWGGFHTFWVNGAESVRFDSYGNAGIGTATPFAKLNVAGDIGAYSNGSAVSVDDKGSQLYLGDSNFNSAGAFHSAPGIGAVNTNNTAVAESLAVYVYTGTLGSRTEVARVSAPRNLDSNFRLTAYGNYYCDIRSNYNSGQSFEITSQGAYILRASEAAYEEVLLGNANTQLLTLNGSVAYLPGRAGVGTTNPSYKLDVHGSGDDVTSGSLQVLNTSDSANAAAIVAVRSATSRGSFAAYPASYISAAYADRVVLSSASDASGISLDASSAGQDIRLLVANIERMRLTDGGNLGVGTTNPTQPLEVAGTIKSTTSLGLLVAPFAVAESAFLRCDNSGGSTYIGMDNSSGTALSGIPFAASINTPVALVCVVGGVVRSTLTANGEYLNGDVVIAGGGGFGRTLAVGTGGAVQQNSLAIYGHTTINYAPVLSLYRAGSRECTISIASGDLCFANTTGFANYQDTTLLAASSMRLRSTGEVTTTSSFETQGATVGASNSWQAKSQDVASGYWILASTNTGHGMQMHSAGYLDTTFGYAIHSGSADPTVSDVAGNSSLMWKNTTSGEVRHWVNDGGTMLKSAAYS